MENRQRLRNYILLNIVVSALTTWIVLTVWARANPGLQIEANDLPLNVTSAPGGSLPQIPATPKPGDDEVPPPLSGAQVAGQLEIASIVGAGDLESERVLIRHVGNIELDLTGWRLRDEQGNEFAFPRLTMFPGGAVRVYTKVGTVTVVELYWNLAEPVWETGETATLLDPAGNPQATYTVP
ncbi:MAG: lamin tail domain-containing protein [Anaerolineae bacterium]|nr:lamin tail domain-containing protein [Anaerolineae bacterium]